MTSLLYFFWISITVSLALVWALKRSESRKFPSALTFQVTGWLILINPLGARLIHIVYEEPQYYLTDPLKVFAVWEGGFVYYGGLLASLIFGLIFFHSKRREKNFWQTTDFLTPVFCFGTGFGRIACFLQGCCYGKPYEGFLSIGHRYPTQLYMVLWEMILLAGLIKWEKQKPKPDGVLFLSWLGLSGLGRFIVEFYRDDFRGSLIFGLSISQVISLGLLLFSSIWIIRLKKRSV